MTPVVERIRDIGFALQAMDWTRVDAQCGLLAELLRRTSEPPTRLVVQLLAQLRRKRRFACMTMLAEPFIQFGRATPIVKRQYAQALIDSGLLGAAAPLLRELAVEAHGTPEGAEAQGLLGRTLKQAYVNAARAGQPLPALLQGAMDAYANAYIADRARNIWHGINAVAVAERARRDGHQVGSALQAVDVAREILAAVERAEEDNFGVSDPWLAATAMEAHVALGTFDAALDRAMQYATDGLADAFELASTLRQLEEVWQLTDDSEPGSSILPLLRGALLARQGSTVTHTPESAPAEAARVKGLEKVFGHTGTQTLAWYRNGLERCTAIARIERTDRRGEGTGWLARSGDLFQNGSDEPVLVTNAHVVCDAATPVPGAFQFDEIVANFQILKHETLATGVVWCSPVEQFDCTVLRLKDAPNVTLPLASRKVRAFKPPPRMYIIGHPGGRDLELSLQDNHLLDCDDTYLHYRTPTEGGSSGSPVFDETWNVVGLHHKGDTGMQRLNGAPGTYDANEAIAVRAILTATKALMWA
jgi:hypothetical protein